MSVWEAGITFALCVICLLTGALAGRASADAGARARERDAYETGRRSRDGEVANFQKQSENYLQFARDVIANCDAKVQRLTEHRVRVERAEAGLPEFEVNPREAVPRQPMTQELYDWIGEFRHPETRQELMARANQMLAAGMSSPDVLDQFKREGSVE